MPASECMSIRVLSHVYHSAFMHRICHAYCAVHVCPCTATRCVYLRHRCVFLRHHASGPALSTVLPPRVWALSTVLRSQYGVAATGTASTRPAAAGKCGEFRRPWCGMKRAKQTLFETLVVQLSIEQRSVQKPVAMLLDSGQERRAPLSSPAIGRGDLPVRRLHTRSPCTHYIYISITFAAATQPVEMLRARRPRPPIGA